MIDNNTTGATGGFRISYIMWNFGAFINTKIEGKTFLIVIKRKIAVDRCKNCLIK
jgi:hypothetical protein